MWGIANLGWMYYEVVLHSEPPSASVVRFLFGLEKRVVRHGLVSGPRQGFTADRRGILFGLHPGRDRFLFYLSRILLSAGSSLGRLLRILREMRVENLEDVFLTGGCRQSAALAKTAPRKLYGGLALYLLLLTVCAATAQYLQSVKPAQRGLARPAMDGSVSRFCEWAARWQPDPARKLAPY